MADAIIFDELLKAMEQVSGGEGFTTAELMEAEHITDDRARAIIKRGLKKKILRISRKTVTDMAGRSMTVPSYVFVRRGK